MRLRIEVASKTFDVELERAEEGWDVVVDGQRFPARVDRRGTGATVRLDGGVHHVHTLKDGAATIDGSPVAYVVQEIAGPAAQGGAAASAQVRPPMTGTLESVSVAPGDEVTEGQVLFVLEAMKMRNEVRCPRAGRVAAVHAEAGRAVDPSLVVVELEP